MTERLCFLNLIGTVLLAICFAVHVGESRRPESEVRTVRLPDAPKQEGGDKPIVVAATAAPKTTKLVVASVPRLTYWKTVTAKVTAYEPSGVSCRPHANGKTSTGSNAWRMNGCAVDPRAIPYGTVVEIPGIGRRVADDTGGAMRRNWERRGRYHVDVRMTYVWQCRQWGGPTLRVKLYRRTRGG